MKKIIVGIAIAILVAARYWSWQYHGISEAEVYSAYLQVAFDQNSMRKPTLLAVRARTEEIERYVETVGPPGLEITSEQKLARYFPAATTRALSSLVKMGSASGSIGSEVIAVRGKNIRVQIVTDEDYLKSFGNDNALDEKWSHFYRLHPHSNGMLMFSRAGVDADRHQAIFFVSWNCGPMCGLGTAVMMEKRDRKWIMVSEEVAWRV